MFFFSSHFFISLFSAICSWVNVLTLICIYYFCNFAAWNGSPWTHQRKCAIRQNDFSFTQIKLVYCLTRKTLKWNSLVQKICLFLQKETSHCKSSLTTTFTRKMPRSSDSMYFFHFMLENIWHHHFTWSVANSQKVVKFVPIMGPRESELN